MKKQTSKNLNISLQMSFNLYHLTTAILFVYFKQTEMHKKKITLLV